MTKEKANDRWFGDVKMLTSHVIMNMLKAKGEPCQVDAHESLDKLDTSELWEVFHHCRDRCVDAPQWVRYFDAESLARISFELGKRDTDAGEFREKIRGGRPPKQKPTKLQLEAEIEYYNEEQRYSMRDTMKKLSKEYDLSTSTLYAIRNGPD